MSVTDERIETIATGTVARFVRDLADDNVGLGELLSNEDGYDDLDEVERDALGDRLADALRRHLPQERGRTLRERAAELSIVRGNLEKIASGPHAPNGTAVLAALFVTKEEIKVWLASNPEGEPC